MNDPRTYTLALALSLSLPAQDLIPKTHAQTRPVLIQGATIHPVGAATIPVGQILFAAGRIQAIAEARVRLERPANTLVIDARGKHVYPGLISAVTTLGLVEIGQVPATIDRAEVNPIAPEVRALVAVNPDSTTLPVARRNGVLAAGVFPQGGLISGRAGVIQLDGWTYEDMGLRAEAGMVVTWPAQPRPGRSRSRRPGSDPRDVRELRKVIAETFDRARAYLRARKADPQLPEDIRFEPFRAVLERRSPVFLRADTREQIESSLAWAEQRGLRTVILGGRAAPACARLLKRLKVPVIVLGTHRLPRRRDADVVAPFTLPQRLQAQGITWCLASDGTFYNERNLPYHAATAVAHGLDPDLALRSISLSAAEILGVDKDLGSLAKGKLATLIITNGNPMEIGTRVERAFVSGRQIDLRSKQTQLYEKYREKYRQLGILPR